MLKWAPRAARTKMAESAAPTCRIPIRSASSTLFPAAGWSWTSISSGAWMMVRLTATTAPAPSRPRTAAPQSRAETPSITGRVKT